MYLSVRSSAVTLIIPFLFMKRNDVFNQKDAFFLQHIPCKLLTITVQGCII